MEQKNTQAEVRSRCTWEGWEEFVRDHVQRFIPGLLEEEVRTVLERPQSGRRTAVDAPGG